MAAVAGAILRVGKGCGAQTGGRGSSQGEDSPVRTWGVSLWPREGVSAHGHVPVHRRERPCSGHREGMDHGGGEARAGTPWVCGYKLVIRVRVELNGVKHAPVSMGASECECVGLRARSSAREGVSRSERAWVWKGEEFEGQQAGACSWAGMNVGAVSRVNERASVGEGWGVRESWGQGNPQEGVVWRHK